MMSSYKIGMNLRVTEDSNQGGRRYMEDKHSIRFVKNDEGGFEFAYFGIFDGHGGGEASKFARDHLLNEITKYDCFWSDSDDDILFAIKSGFLDCHYGMWKQVEKWPKTSSGFLSTSGTTASICIIKNSKLYIGHVGDSGIVLGYDDSKSEKLVVPKAKMLTTDHKPDSPMEKKRIEESGGQVVAKSGVQRVVWNRPRNNHKGPIRRSTPIDKIPFLAVARSLGDLWSYNYSKEEFVVSPEPDVSVYKLNPAHDKCLIIGSDGLWNMMSANDAVNTVVDLEYQFEYKIVNDPSVPVSYWINPAERLVQMALNKWRMKMMKADNTSCIVVLIDPMGPRKLSLLKKKREEVMKIQNEKRLSSAKSPVGEGHPSSKDSPSKVSQKTGTSKSLPALGLGGSSKGQVLWSAGSHGTMSQKDDFIGQSPMHQFTDNLDESVQIRNAHLVTPLSPSQDDQEKHSKSPPVSHSPARKTSPLQNSENLTAVRPGMATRSSPQKLSPCTKARAVVEKESCSPKTRGQEEAKHRRSGVQSKTSSSAGSKTSPGSAQDSQKCLQPSKTSSENVRNSSTKLVNSLKDVENMFSSNEVKISLRNLTLGKGKKKAGKNLNNSNVGESRGGKKKGSTKSLSSRISLRLRRIRQKSLRNTNKTVSHTENKGFTVKTGIKRKLDSQQGSPSMKKMKMS